LLLEDDQRLEKSFYEICDEAAKIAEELLDRPKNSESQEWKASCVGKSASRSESCMVKERGCIIEAATFDGQGVLAIKINAFVKVKSSSAEDFLLPDRLTSTRQRIDAELIRSSTRFDFLDAQKQQILTAMASTREGIS
jgi:hypothetical protein